LDKLSREKTKNEAKKNILALGFQFKLLSELGYKAEVEKCVGCCEKLTSGRNYFSVSCGGILCSECGALDSRKIRAEDEAIKFIRIFLRNSIGSLAKLGTAQNDLRNLKAIAKESINWLLNEG
jgi:DNA repair protein RecO